MRRLVVGFARGHRRARRAALCSPASRVFREREGAAHRRQHRAVARSARAFPTRRIERCRCCISRPAPAGSRMCSTRSSGPGTMRASPGSFARIGDGELGLAQAQELRDAIAQFRAKGKSPSPIPTVSANSARARAAITLPPRSTRSGCSRWARRAHRPARRGAVLPRHARSARPRPALRPSRRIQIRGRHLTEKTMTAGAPRAAPRRCSIRLATDRQRHRRRPQARPAGGARARSIAARCSRKRRSRRISSTVSAIATRR